MINVNQWTTAEHARPLAIRQKQKTLPTSYWLLVVETQLGWFKELGCQDVDCYWKWLELALLIGFKPL
jgi:hypothetical protein